MKTIKVNLGKNSYHILIGSGILPEIGEAVKGLGFSKKAVIVTNPTVGERYEEPVFKSLEASGFLPHVVRIPDGEEYKTIDSACKLYDEFLRWGVDRKSAVFALGGGVIGDITGFAAATFMRGLPCVQVPTTLLAQVDSSVGGKTAVDHPEGKNMIGVFSQPRLVYMDLSVLKTLGRKELSSGLVEAAKYGVIRDKEFFEFLRDNIELIRGLSPSHILRVVSRSCRIKADIVEMDEREDGLRSILNYGHTIGHAIESAGSYKTYSHGEAVLFGMICAGRISRELGFLDEASLTQQKNLLGLLGLPMTMGSVGVDSVLAKLRLDKKIIDGKMRFVLARGIGDVFLAEDVSVDAVKNAIRSITPRIEGA